MDQKKYLKIVSYLESCLEKYGDTHLGVDWKAKEDAEARYGAMLDVIKPGTSGRISLLDFGCGASHLYEHILQHGLDKAKHKAYSIEYTGLDLGAKYIDLSRKKFPSRTYYHLNILEDPDSLANFDYIVMNGVFTAKYDSGLSFDEMFEYLKAIVRILFDKAQIGIAFNMMSKHVDWERDDLFHLPFDLLAAFLVQSLSRQFVFRHDYALYEYTAYVYK
jgi:hypothetical protein